MVQIACPSCGNPVKFRAEHTLYAACEACSSLVVRKDVNLEVIGKAGELQPDGSLLRVGTQGVFQEKSFEIIGRIQIKLGPPKLPTGFWNEWHAIFSDGREGWIGEAMGAYFVCFQREAAGGLPNYGKLALGGVLKLEHDEFVVTSKATGQVTGFEGELPFVHEQEYKLEFADLRSASQVGATLDYSGDQPLLFVGRWCTFDELKFAGLAWDDADYLPQGAAAAVTTLKCATCGAPHELRAGAISQTLVCQYCDTAMDLNTDQTFARVQKYDQERGKIQGLIPIGAKGTLGEESKTEWECLGFLRKSVQIEGVYYYWSEYLLYNRQRGYRWLTESNGHWTLLESQNSVPTDAQLRPVGRPPQFTVNFNGRPFKHFQRAQARTEYVAGEFYWRVRAGEVSLIDDYVSPPFVLSCDSSNEEVVWSLGVYYDGQKLWRDFKLEGSPPAPTGVANNQVNPYLSGRERMWTQYLVTVLIAFFMLAAVAMKSNRPVWTQSFRYDYYEAERSRVMDVELPGRTSNVKFNITSNFENRWAVWQLTLINDETHVAYDTGCQVSFYRDADGTYGSHSSSVILPSVPPGKYLFRLEPVETGTGETAEQAPKNPPDITQPNPTIFTYTVDIYRDVPLWGFFWPFALVLLVPPVWVTYKSSSFETQRWMESDHPPISSGGEEED